ncbi:DUF7507 domain-containing protein [Rhodococcus rhodnii]|uniref:DUF11 domain-containing protein n=1 Tax=Rhodococcus rhodnii LMG 5362 TaxID=1273125 RepID=R7WUK6_9NOCA|nr:DUF11 domain-containing protein [Rhodococcus rhodnii]EOM77804.1 hypothetical protein Rrhod_0790 [Rhodococcus rhodnii LMG 5362]
MSRFVSKARSVCLTVLTSLLVMTAGPAALAQPTTTPPAAPTTQPTAPATQPAPPELPTTTPPPTTPETTAPETTPPETTVPTTETEAPPPGAPRAPLSCLMLYSIDNNAGYVQQIDPETGAYTDAFPIDATTSNNNQLGISTDGRYAIYTSRPSSSATSPKTIYRYDTQTGETTSTPASNAVIHTHGAINPANGLFYYGGRAASGGTIDVAAYDPETGTDLGLVMQVTVPDTDARGDQNGDLAFDSHGNMYVVLASSSQGAVYSVAGPVPSSGPAQPLEATRITERTSAFASADSIAFNPFGYLYVGQGTSLVVIDPRSGEAVDTHRTTEMTDMASCSTPSSIAVFKNLPAGRFDPDDQFTLEISGDGLSENVTETTAGDGIGIQDQQIAPHIVLGGDVVTVTETAAGDTDFANYQTTWECINARDGTVLASGDSPQGGQVQIPTVPVTGTNVECTFTNTPLTVASIALEKTATPTVMSTVGEVISYEFVVTNTGRSPVANVRVEERDWNGSGPMSVIACPAETLPSGASLTCTASYVVQQGDLDRGLIHNEAQALGDSRAGQVVSNLDDADVVATRAPNIALVKVADPPTMSTVGETIDYEFRVTNTGNTTLTDVGIDEVEWTGSGQLSAIVCPPEAASVAPGDSVTCTATYQVQQGDLDRGSIYNVATSTGTPPGMDPITSNEADALVTGEPNADIALVKTGAPVSGLREGDTVNYSFEVTNTGNTTLTNVRVEETFFSGSGQMSEIVCPDTPLEPGDSLTCTATYVITAQDVEAGSVTNTAVAYGDPPEGDPVESSPSTVVVTTVKDGDDCCIEIIVPPIIIPPGITPPGPPGPPGTPGTPGTPGAPGTPGGPGGQGGSQQGGQGGQSGQGQGGQGQGGQGSPAAPGGQGGQSPQTTRGGLGGLIDSGLGADAENRGRNIGLVVAGLALLIAAAVASIVVWRRRH